MKARSGWWLIVVAAGLMYPLAVIAGGAPRFPSRTECVHAAKADGNLEAVFGRYRSETRALVVLRRALRVGFQGTEIESDGCGFLKVTLHEIPTLQVGRAFISQARTVGFHPMLEQSSP